MICSVWVIISTCRSQSGADVGLLEGRTRDGARVCAGPQRAQEGHTALTQVVWCLMFGYTAVRENGHCQISRLNAAQHLQANTTCVSHRSIMLRWLIALSVLVLHLLCPLELLIFSHVTGALAYQHLHAFNTLNLSAQLLCFFLELIWAQTPYTANMWPWTTKPVIRRFTHHHK